MLAKSSIHSLMLKGFRKRKHVRSRGQGEFGELPISRHRLLKKDFWFITYMANMWISKYSKLVSKYK